jgi:nickel/cobalt transporter (NicO) family protein
MRVLILLALLVGFLLPVAAVPAFSQSTETAQQAPAKAIDRSKLLVQRRGGSDISFIANPVLWMTEKQREFYGSMSKSMRQMATTSASTATSTLLWLSFLYGLFHAAGPGHGKVVITTWLVATRSDVKRGLLVAFLSALVQALVAIMAVSAILYFVSAASAAAREAAQWLESASYAMIAALGLYLVASAFRGHHAHHHKGHDHQGHEHDHHHAHDHAHTATPKQLRGDWSLWKAASMAIAIGIRPCTGAILVLLFSSTIGLYWVGVASTLMMGFGVFIAMAALSLLAVFARDAALSVAARDDARLDLIAKVLKIGGGVVIAGLGLLLFFGSLGQTGGLA